MSDIERMIAALDDLLSSELRARWTTLTRTPVPHVNPKLLRLALA
jgi:hypothetical protein